MVDGKYHFLWRTYAIVALKVQWAYCDAEFEQIRHCYRQVHQAGYLFPTEVVEIDLSHLSSDTQVLAFDLPRRMWPTISIQVLSQRGRSKVRARALVEEFIALVCEPRLTVAARSNEKVHEGDDRGAEHFPGDRVTVIVGNVPWMELPPASTPTQRSKCSTETSRQHFGWRHCQRWKTRKQQSRHHQGRGREGRWEV